MKNFNALSGPWTGLSIQDGIRISERIMLSISGGKVSGSGSDMDGEFELSGFYEQKKERVMLTRRYTWTTEPTQESVGIAFDYEGVWDGRMVSGLWHSRHSPEVCGPFEMWPNRDEDRKELMIEFEEQSTLALPE